MKYPPKISLVGAGPGDAELITLKGLRKLREANVVLYDALVNRELLEYVPKGCQLVYVGKRAGMHKYSQEEINQMLVDMAWQHGHAVRLKGGDPMVFGRGNEELRFAMQHGIPVDIVPGLSSASAVLSANLIPLTSRGINESFTVLTGSTRSGEISHDLQQALTFSKNVVVLMGLKKLKNITAYLQAQEMNTMPVAVVEKGTTEQQKLVFGTADNILSKTQENSLKGPAIIIIGAMAEEGRVNQEMLHALQGTAVDYAYSA